MATKLSLKRSKGRRPKSQANIRSPNEIEECIKSTSTVKWDPFTLFPAEVYLQIFRNLDNSTDQENLMNAHVKFYDLFKSYRVDFLFGKIFNDLLWELRSSSYITGDNYLLGLRLVCRKWDKAIQNHYQLHPSFFQFDKEDKSKCEDDEKRKRDSGIPSTKFCWSNARPHNILTDWTNIQASHSPERNPFLTRSVEIREMLKDNVKFHIWDEIKGKAKERTWWTQIEGFLKVYGHHIWHLKLLMHWRVKPEVSSRVVSLLKWLPKLRSLRISSLFSSLFYKYEPTSEDLKLENVLAPEMNELEYLEVRNFPKVICNRILEGMKGLQKMQVIIFGHCGKQYLDGYQLPASLKEACLSVKGVRDYQYLKSLKPNPFLKKLIIQSVSDNKEEDNENESWPEWKMIWSVIEEKFPGLEDLNLDLPEVGDDSRENKIKALKQSLGCRLNLKRLKRLTIYLPNLSSLDFLKKMKELKEIEVYVGDLLDETGGFMRLKYLHLLKGECIKFNKSLSTMSKSNIWKVLPKLRKLNVKTYSNIYAYEKKGIEINCTPYTAHWVLEK